MFILSLHSSKIKTIAIIAAIAVCVGGAVMLTLKGGAREAGVKRPESIRGASSGERMEFLTSLGWEADAEPIEVTEIIIPEEFDDVYTGYNELQKECGYNLEAYRGLRVKRWTYRITNCDGYSSASDCIRANLLVYDGLIIGGDICSVELNGFMTGLINKSNLSVTDITS